MFQVFSIFLAALFHLFLKSFPYLKSKKLYKLMIQDRLLDLMLKINFGNLILIPKCIFRLENLLRNYLF